MISLITPTVEYPTTDLVGVVKEFSADSAEINEVVFNPANRPPSNGSKWYPLSGGFLSVDENPLLFAILGFRFGRLVDPTGLYFGLPKWNGSGVDSSPTWPRGRNNNNTLGRNLNKNILDVVQAALKGHNHSGSTSSGGNHSHGSVSGSQFATNQTVMSHGGNSPPFANYGIGTSSLGHSGHSHSGATGVMNGVAAEFIGVEVQPKGYTSILCIYGG